jgi:hypothetical protein
VTDLVVLAVVKIGCRDVNDGCLIVGSEPKFGSCGISRFEGIKSFLSFPFFPVIVTRT